jgi:hypothetical protein
MHTSMIGCRRLWAALLLPTLLVGGAPVWAEPPKPAPAAIPVVKTWAELRRVPAVEVRPGLSVRLGIEAVECPVAHGVFLYCLTDGYAPPEYWSQEDRLGPLHLTLTDGDGKQLDFWGTGFGLEAHQKVPAGLDKCELLFLRLVVVPRTTAIRVRLEARSTGGDPRVVAAGELKAAGTPHPFVRFEVTGPEPKPGQTEFRVRNKGTGPALPRWPESCPIVGRGAADGKKVARADDEALPRLIPAEPSPDLKLSVADGVLTVRSAAGTGTAAPDDEFLARWWVNGKPVVPAVPTEPDLGVLGWQLTTDNRPEIRLALDLALDRLGAKSGDLIGVQVLHTEYGADAVSDQKLSILKGWKRPTLPILSNRVEFRAK